jgi:hypothetical protein
VRPARAEGELAYLADSLFRDRSRWRLLAPFRTTPPGRVATALARVTRFDLPSAGTGL